MSEQSKTVSKEIEQALKAVEQAKARLQRAKSKEADRKRREDTHNKIVWGGIVKKYFPDCALFEESCRQQLPIFDSQKGKLLFPFGAENTPTL